MYNAFFIECLKVTSEYREAFYEFYAEMTETPSYGKVVLCKKIQ